MFWRLAIRLFVRNTARAETKHAFLPAQREASAASDLHEAAVGSLEGTTSPEPAVSTAAEAVVAAAAAMGPVDAPLAELACEATEVHVLPCKTSPGFP